MAYNGSGTFNLYTPGNPVVTGTTISSTWANNTLNDIATGLSTAVTKDGQTTTTARVPFASGLSTASGLAFPSVQVASSDAYTLDDYRELTFAPTVTLVGGAGNAVPEYATNTGRYTKIGNRCYVDILLSGDGGAEGAGTGTMTIALPITSGASNPASTILCGVGVNNATSYLLVGSIGGGAGVISLSFFSLITQVSAFTGADQNNATRGIRLSFFYETAT